MKKLIRCGAVLVSFMVACHSALAAVNCALVASLVPTRTDIISLNPPTTSAGVDIPVGTIIYQGRWHSAPGINLLKCTSATDTSVWFNVASDLQYTANSLSSWAGSPFGGAVYQTIIPGVGIAVSTSPNGGAITTAKPGYLLPSDAEGKLSAGAYTLSAPDSTLYFSLIKIGALTPGSYNLSSSTLLISNVRIVAPLTHTAPVSGIPLWVYSIFLQGEMTVSTQTCATPDVNVTLGTYDKGQHFTGLGEATPWIDASIILTGCPTFSGFYNQNNSTLLFDSSTGLGSVATATNNSIGVRLTPAGGVVDAANGIMAIDSSASGAASGIGIQIGWGNSSQTPTPFNFTAESSMTLPKDGSPMIRVPLAARYIQTATTPTPGKANGKLVFTINYY